VKHDLSLVTYAQSLGHRVLLDAAALLPMTRLSLRRIPADFVALSFYKMFGYPTGVGALVARRDALEQLDRPWFSGGTVDFASVQNDVHGLRHDSAAFEDGTPNFLGIAAIPAGLSYLESIGVQHIDAHARTLAMQLVETLVSGRHRNGSRIADVYGPVTPVGRGATVAFNLYDERGKCIAYPLVEKRAQSMRVSVRGGCFCNPGASEAAFRFPAEEAASCLEAARRRGWSVSRFAECLPDYPVGAVRASFGAPSNRSDLDRLLAVIESFSLG
jgi:selenocysteine lyase/cysteine desulfurase